MSCSMDGSTELLSSEHMEGLEVDPVPFLMAMDTSFVSDDAEADVVRGFAFLFDFGSYDFAVNDFPPVASIERDLASIRPSDVIRLAE